MLGAEFLAVFFRQLGDVVPRGTYSIERRGGRITPDFGWFARTKPS